MRKLLLAILIPLALFGAKKHPKKVVHDCCLCMCGKKEPQCDKFCDLKKDAKGDYIAMTKHEEYDCAAKCNHLDRK